MPNSLFMSVISLLPLAIIVHPSWLSLIVLGAVFVLLMITRVIARNEGHAIGHSKGFKTGYDRGIDPKFVSRALD